MKILYVAPQNPSNINVFSGISYYIYQSFIELGHQVTCCNIPDFFASKYGGLKHRFYSRVYNKQYFTDADPIVNTIWRYFLNQKLKSLNVDYDLVFSWHPWAGLLVKTNKPYVFWYDSTFDLSLGHYYTKFCDASVEQSLARDRKALERCSFAIYSSEWAAQSARKTLGFESHKVFSIPFGANLDQVPTPTDVEQAIDRRIQRQQHKEIKLLFIGRDWQRKDGQTALDVLSLLNTQGYQSHLTIVGCEPKISDSLKDRVTIHPFLDKNHPADRTRISNLYLDSDFFIMTSFAESYGIVYCEALAHGCPCLATNVGGVGTIVSNGNTGYLFERQDDLPHQILTTIIQCCQSPENYQQLAQSCYQAYRDSFNWSTAAQKLNPILEKAIADFKTR